MLELLKSEFFSLLEIPKIENELKQNFLFLQELIPLTKSGQVNAKFSQSFSDFSKALEKLADLRKKDNSFKLVVKMEGNFVDEGPFRVKLQEVEQIMQRIEKEVVALENQLVNKETALLRIEKEVAALENQLVNQETLLSRKKKEVTALENQLVNKEQPAELVKIKKIEESNVAQDIQSIEYLIEEYAKVIHKIKDLHFDNKTFTKIVKIYIENEELLEDIRARFFILNDDLLKTNANILKKKEELLDLLAIEFQNENNRKSEIFSSNTFILIKNFYLNLFKNAQDDIVRKMYLKNIIVMYHNFFKGFDFFEKAHLNFQADVTMVYEFLKKNIIPLKNSSPEILHLADFFTENDLLNIKSGIFAEKQFFLNLKKKFQEKGLSS